MLRIVDFGYSVSHNYGRFEVLCSFDKESFLPLIQKCLLYDGNYNKMHLEMPIEELRDFYKISHLFFILVSLGDEYGIGTPTGLDICRAFCDLTKTVSCEDFSKADLYCIDITHSPGHLAEFSICIVSPGYYEGEYSLPNASYSDYSRKLSLFSEQIIEEHPEDRANIATYRQSNQTYTARVL